MNKKIHGEIVTDPFSNTQTRFHRTDPTGRFIKLETEDPINAWGDYLRYGLMCAVCLGLVSFMVIFIFYAVMEVI